MRTLFSQQTSSVRVCVKSIPTDMAASASTAASAEEEQTPAPAERRLTYKEFVAGTTAREAQATATAANARALAVAARRRAGAIRASAKTLTHQACVDASDEDFTSASQELEWASKMHEAACERKYLTYIRLACCRRAVSARNRESVTSPLAPAHACKPLSTASLETAEATAREEYLKAKDAMEAAFVAFTAAREDCDDVEKWHTCLLCGTFEIDINLNLNLNTAFGPPVTRLHHSRALRQQLFNCSPLEFGDHLLFDASSSKHFFAVALDASAASIPSVHRGRMLKKWTPSNHKFFMNEKFRACIFQLLLLHQRICASRASRVLLPALPGELVLMIAEILSVTAL